MKLLWGYMALMLLTGCQWYQELEVVSVQGLSKAHWTLQGVDGALEVVVFNPNPFPVKAVAVDLALYAGDARIGTVQLPGQQVLARQSQSPLKLEFSSVPGALLTLIQNELFGFLKKGDLEIRAEGTVTAKAWGLTLTFPIQATEAIQIQQP